MTAAHALKLFFRRMICLKLANLCPFVAGRIFLYRRMGICIGEDVFVGFGVEFDTNHSDLIEIEDHVTISHRCIIASHMATSSDTPLQRLYPPTAAQVVIGKGAWLCTGAIVLPGVRIGENALVAAGAVVSRDVEAATLVAGVPARAIKTLDL